MRIFIAASACLLVCGAAYATQENAAKDQAVRICRTQKAAVPAEQWQKGPCLSNSTKELPDWVVDVAHVPRQAVDEEVTNQCSMYTDPKVQGVIEVDTECRVIRAGKK